MVNQYLMHHGILGQKWGVRRYQNEDGTLTVAGKERYASNSTSEETNKETKKQLTDKQKKALIIAGSVAVATSLAVIGAYSIKAYGLESSHHIQTYDFSEKNISEYSNVRDTISSGTKFQRITTRDAFEDYVTTGEQAYVSFTKHDNGLYMHSLPAFFKDWESKNVIASSKPYVVNLKAKTDIRVASDRDAVDAFMKVSGITTDTIKDGSFKTFMVGANDRKNKKVEAFYNELKKNGFNAVKDYNDLGWAESPLIVIDPASVFDVTKSGKKTIIDEIVTVLKS